MISYLVDVFLVCFLAERVTVIDVGNLIQHFRDLLCELQIGSRKADSNLCSYESVILMQL
jgi:hypothetical protein